MIVLRRGGAVLAAALLEAAMTLFACRPAAAAQPGSGEVFRVCADPNNLPYSDDRAAGFENKLAQVFAGEMGEPVSYTWWAQRRGYIRHTLKAGKCDVLMGVPKGLDMVDTTRPYYRSTFVFVTRSDRHLDIASITDSRLRTLKIGVQLIGNDGFNTPPAHALAEQGIIDNVHGYTVYGDYRQPDRPAPIVEAVEQGDIDIAAVWGPLAGYFARQSPIGLAITPITNTERFAPLLFQFDIAIGVRKGDDERRAMLDRLISRNTAKIAQLLEEYGVPVVAGDGQSSANHPESSE